MKKIVLLSLQLVLYGQLIFSALNYYYFIERPSWPLWIILFGFTLLLSLKFFREIKWNQSDLFLFLFVLYLILNFLILGQSKRNEFWERVLTIFVLPYLVGRVLGKYYSISFTSGLYTLTLIYVGLIIYRFYYDLYALLEFDRLVLYAKKELQGVGGSGDAFNLGITLGSCWMASFSYKLFKADKICKVDEKNEKLSRIAIYILPLLILLTSSRSSIVSGIICILFLYNTVTIRIKNLGIIIIIGTIVTLFFLYVIPYQRKSLLEPLLDLITLQFDFKSAISHVDTETDSLIARTVLIYEAVVLFFSSPFWGIGTSNYGLFFRGIKHQFGSPHSIIFQTLAEGGLISFTLYLTLFISIFNKHIRIIKDRTSFLPLNYLTLFSLWLFVFIQSEFIGNYFFNYHFFLLSGLLISSMEQIHK